MTDTPHLPGLDPTGEPEIEAETAITTLTAWAPRAVEVIRSRRRRRTIGAQLRDDVLIVTVPSWLSRADEAHWVEEMTRRFRRKQDQERLDLPARARRLARRFDLPRAASIRWVDNMEHRWGSCTIQTGAIRLSSRLARFPDWVVDYVIVHELAHLRVADHSDAFWDLVNRYPRSERAIGYLIAKSGDVDDVD